MEDWSSRISIRRVIVAVVVVLATVAILVFTGELDVLMSALFD
jgi:hypothetical protein